MPNTHGSPLWYELMTRDPAKAIAFYGPILGWTSAPQGAGGEGPDYHVISHGADGVGGMLTLTDAMCEEGGARPGWLGYITVDDVDAAVADVTNAGGGVLMPAWTVPDVGRMALVSDPQGVPFYVMRGAIEGETSKAFSVTDAGHVRWHELATPDLDGALAFYSGRFGWKAEDAMDMGPELGPYQFFSHDGVTLGAMMRESADFPKAWTYVFGVEDIDVGAAAVTSGGGQVVVEAMEIPGGEYALYAVDPEGVVFGLVGPRK